MKEEIYLAIIKHEEGDKYEIQAFQVCIDENGECSEPHPITVDLSQYELPELKEPGFYTIYIGEKNNDHNKI